VWGSVVRCGGPEIGFDKKRIVMSLTAQELEVLKGELGEGRSVLASGIAEVWLAQAKDNAPLICALLQSGAQTGVEKRNGWISSLVSGALLFVIDRDIGTLLFQVFDLSQEGMPVLRYQSELYESLVYRELALQFHCFELENCQVGFNFADAAVAKEFRSKVITIVGKAKKRKKKTVFSGVLSRKGNSRQRNISTVTGVVHQVHVKRLQDGSVDFKGIPNAWKHLFQEAGLKAKDFSNGRLIEAIAKRQSVVNGVYERNLREGDDSLDENQEEEEEEEKSDELIESSRAAFLREIEQGNRNLKAPKFNKSEQRPSRPAFLNDIDGGIVKLRRISQIEVLPEIDLAIDGEGIMQKLKAMVEARRKVITNDFEMGESGGEEEEEEWEHV